MIDSPQLNKYYIIVVNTQSLDREAHCFPKQEVRQHSLVFFFKFYFSPFFSKNQGLFPCSIKNVEKNFLGIKKREPLNVFGSINFGQKKKE